MSTLCLFFKWEVKQSEIFIHIWNTIQTVGVFVHTSLVNQQVFQTKQNSLEYYGQSGSIVQGFQSLPVWRFKKKNDHDNLYAIVQNVRERQAIFLNSDSHTLWSRKKYCLSVHNFFNHFIDFPQPDRPVGASPSLERTSFIDNKAPVEVAKDRKLFFTYLLSHFILFFEARLDRESNAKLHQTQPSWP